MTKHVLLVTLLQLSITSFGQNFIWSKNIGSNGNDGGNAIKVQQDGSIYSCGYFYETIDADPGEGVFNLTSSGSADAYLIKQNSNGDLLWAKKFGGGGVDRAYDLDFDMDGNVYLTGHFFGNVDFDPGAGTLMKSSNGQHDIFISKISPDGDLIWVNTIGGEETDYGRAITLSSNGDVYVTGFYSETVDFDPGAGVMNYSATTMQYYDVFITKYDMNGAFIWAKSIGGPGMEDSFDIVCDQNDDIYIAGFFEATADFNPGSANEIAISNGGYDVFILKLNDNGQLVWNRTIGGVENDIARAVAVDLNNNIVIAGLFSETMDADPDETIIPFISHGFTDAFMIQMNTDGGVNWAKSFGGTENDEAKSIAIDFDNNYYISGWFGSTIEIDSPEISSVNALGMNDVFIQKLHSDGSLGWIQTLGGEGTDYVSGVASDESGSIYLTGNYSGLADFDPGQNDYQTNSNGGSDIFTTKLCYAQLPQDIITGSVEVCNDSEVDYQYIESPYLVEYNWLLPEGATLIAGQNSNVARFTFTQPVNELILVTQNACGMTYEASIEVLAHEVPEILIDAYPSLDICQGETIRLTASGAENVVWNDNIVNGENFIASESREYIVTATNGPNCTATASIAVEVKETPQIAVQADHTSVCGNGEVVLNASGANDIAWAEGIVSGVPVSVNETRTFHAMGMSENGCLGAAEITIDVHPLPEVTAHASDQHICHGNSVTIYSSGGQNVIWSNGLMENESITLDQTTTLVVATSDEFGCTGYDDITIVVHEDPIISVDASSTDVCRGSAVILEGIGGENYQWSHGVNDSQPFEIIETTTFTVSAENQYGCIGESEITIEVHETPVILNQPTTQTAMIGHATSFSIETEFAADSYRWQKSDGTGFENIENDAIYSGIGTSTLHISEVDEEMNGYYFRCIISSGPCTEFSEVASLNTTPDFVTESKEVVVNIYPNPASEFIQLAWSGKLIGQEFNIYDQTGRMVKSATIQENITVMNVSELAKGIYTVVVPNSSQIPVRFVVK
jgi:hypothetical protein